MRRSFSAAGGPVTNIDLAQTLKALAVPQRLRLLALLRQGELGVSELSAALRLSRPQVYRHLRPLIETGLVVANGRSARKRRITYRIESTAVDALNASYFTLLGQAALPAGIDDPSLPITPPPQACQSCLNSRYVYGLLESIQRQLEESREHQAQLRRISSQMLTAQEEERKRIARELHDDTAQALASMLVRLRLLERAVGDGEAKGSLSEFHDLVASTLEGVRRMALDLRPSALDDLGLVPALQWYTDNFGRSWGIKARFRANGLNRRLPPEIELVLYRVAQEALTNVAKHAQASRLAVELERLGSSVRLTIEDDGSGFDVERSMSSKERGLGLFGMQERLALVGGRFQIESHPGKGTKLVAEVPLRHPSPAIGG